MKNYRYFLKINKLTASIITALFWTGNAAAVNTHIQTDGTLSGIAELNIDAPGSGLPYTLSEINGKLSGHNLFYSFSSFSIGTADSVLFDLNTPDLAHVISRVTGGFESLIDGKLQMTNAGSTPSFFFINPAGITFSSGASVDVPGSFYVSTASGLNFSDGGQLAANETSASSLSSANPESFGFLGNESGSINIGSLETNATGLVFKPGTDVVFTANRMQIDNATIGNSNSSTQTGVDLQLIATGSEATDIQLNASPDHATSGDLVFHNANLMISGNGLGHLGIRAGDFLMKDSGLLVLNIGDVSMTESQGISISAKSVISDNTFFGTDSQANGDAGNIKIIADSLRLINQRGMVSMNSNEFSGKSGDVYIDGRQVEIDNASIQTGTGNDKDGGNIVVTADSLRLTNQGLIASGSFENATGKSGSVTVQARELDITHSMIGSNTNSKGDGGVVTLATDSLKLDDNGQILALTIGEGNSGAVKINTRLLEGNNLSSIAASTFGEGNAGSVDVIADTMTLNNMASVTSGALFRMGNDGTVTTIATGRAGNVTIYAKDLEMNNATIQTDTYGDGKAGDVTVTAESLKLNNDSGFDRGIFSNSRENARGDAGSVTVNAKYIDIDGAFISSSTSGKGNAGTTIITSDSMKLANFGGVSSQPLENSEGHGGLVTIDTKQLEIDRSASISVGTSGAGHAGNVMINADSIKLSDKGNISSGAFKDSSGDGGAIRINAKQIEIAGGFIESRTDGKGSAGNVMITGDILKITNGRITTSSINEDAKAGGSISIDADRLEIVNGFVVSETYGNGNAGQLSVNTDSIQLLENGFISTSTFGKGSAGNVSVTTNSLTAHGAGNSVIDLSSVNLTGIFSGASAESGGKTGTIEVNVKNDIQLNNGAQISIKNDATVAETQLGSLVPTVINIDTTNLFLTNSRIAADSNGNVDAGSIHIHFADQLFLDPSQISTEAASGNGGSITIQGDGAVFLLDSAITTSVSGQSGNGGDIAIAANGLILDSGFIQANTAASGANGGNVDIKTPALVPSGNSLFVGGNTPFQFQPFSGLNVIQAAAPTGVSGVINTATPQLNLNAMLTNLVIESFDANVLNRDMCTVSESSSLMPSGRGAQPLRARDLLLLPLF